MYNDTISNSASGRADQLPERGRHHRRERLSGGALEQHVLQRPVRHPDARAAVQRHQHPCRDVELAGDEQHLRRLIADCRQHPVGMAGDGQAPVQPVLQQRVEPVRQRPTIGDFAGNFGPIFGDPQFVGSRPRRGTSSSSRPLRRSTRRAARSGRLPAGNAIYPDRRHYAQRRCRHPDPNRPGHAAAPQVPGRDMLRSAASHVRRRSPPDRHPAGIGLLQLPRSVGARPDDRSRTATTSPAPIAGNVQLHADLGPARSSWATSAHRRSAVPASATAAIRSSTSVPTSTSICTRPKSPA